MRNLASGHWEPIPAELLEQVYFTEDERSMVSCLRQNNTHTTGHCQEHATLPRRQRVPFFGPLGKLGHTCKHLLLGDVAQHYVHHRHNDLTKSEVKDSRIPRPYGEYHRHNLLRKLPSAVAAWCALDGRSLGFVGDSTVEQNWMSFYLELERHKRKSGFLSRIVTASMGKDVYAVYEVNELPDVPVNCSRVGAIKWWGCLENVKTVEVVGRCGSKDVRSKVSYVKEFVYGEYDLPYILDYDVIFAWLSFHYQFRSSKVEHEGRNGHPYVDDMMDLMRHLGSHGQQGEGKAVIFRESTLQHYGVMPSGDYVRLVNDTWCGPIKDIETAGWSNAIIRQVLERLSVRDICEKDAASPSDCGAVYVLPLHETFHPQHLLHVGSRTPSTRVIVDCTHYCNVPTLFEPIWERLALILRHSKLHSATSAAVNSSCFTQVRN